VENPVMAMGGTGEAMEDTEEAMVATGEAMVTVTVMASAQL